MQKIGEMAYVSTIISGAASLGVLIGLISGIFFLVLTALRWVTRVRESLYEEELRRQKRFLINNSYLVGAGAPDFLETKKVENGFANTSNENNLREKIDHDAISNAGSEQQAIQDASDKQGPNPDTVKVRELIEKMVETMIEGPLDGTTVGQLSTHSAWKKELELDSTDLKQSNLKRLIKRIVSEAMTLPNIKEILRRPKTAKEATNEDFKNKSYEDILATAILNKVIENYQNKNYNENETVDGTPKPRMRSKKLKRNDENTEAKSDDDWSDTSRSDQLSLTIEEYIEEVTTALEVSEDERSELSDFETTNNRRIPFPESGRTVIDAGTDDENSDFEEQNTATELITSSNSWEENWLFQKKRLRSTPNAHHPVPVPMLVPNPSEDFRALVGGVDADDLSDMSDCVDSILEDLAAEENPSKQSAEPESNITKVRNDEYGEETWKEVQSLIQEKSANEKKEILDTRILNEEENRFAVDEECNTQEGPEETAECLGDATLPDVLSQKDRESSIVDFSHQYESLGSHSPSERTTLTCASIEDSEDSTIRCPLAEREKEKWMNPVPLAENPYSLESIEKREQRKKNEYFRIGTYTGESIDFPDDISSDELTKRESEKLRFSRDYYINASKHPAGMPQTFEQQPEDNTQVSRHSYEAFSSLGRRRVHKNPKPDLYPDIADGSAKYFKPQSQPKNLFLPLQNQTMRRQHFSQVFKTSSVLSDDPPKPRSFRKYRYGSHTVKLRSKPKESLFKKPSLEQELSDFEQKSLREDLKHSLLRAKGASPNFILNPVFKPDVVAKTGKMESVKPLLHCARTRESNEDSDGESEKGKSEPIVPSYRRTSGGNTSRAYNKISRVSQESGYGSDSLDYSSDSLEYWRLTPPKTPEVVESSFVSITRNRKTKENSRKLRKTLSDFY